MWWQTPHRQVSLVHGILSFHFFLDWETEVGSDEVQKLCYYIQVEFSGTFNLLTLIFLLPTSYNGLIGFNTLHTDHFLFHYTASQHQTDFNINTENNITCTTKGILWVNSSPVLIT